nr:immunoglobulin heavy chain junction region [Macaca mulatta]MOX60600.1 immunoglobulin heavy chain junction region [Macaca mulatta]MOX60635.1 immunoglobulin heavy chain junction region [Macaca mulatta]MOX61615.1 immunoglobulin heavy chain junction region [Macaca mulatta]MOX62217.1 immunoglobulin heavy chain junction region [Macaca mulatta]
CARDSYGSGSDYW